MRPKLNPRAPTGARGFFVAGTSSVVNHFRPIARFLASAYAALVGSLALWAWYTDVTLLHSTQDHSAPDILLALVSAPASLTLSPLYDRWRALFSTELRQLVWLTFCGAVQVAVLFFLSGLIPTPQRRDRSN
jgi:hypothetical protein